MTTKTATETTEPTADATIEIVYVESDTELHHHYSGQSSPQDCYVWLNCETSKLGATHNAEIGNAVPVAVHHGHTQRWSIPTLKADAANALLEEIAPLAARVVAGYSSEWDGSNHVADFDADAEAAREEIDTLCERATNGADESDTVNVWQARDWFGAVGDAARQCREFGIGPNTTDDELAAIESDEEAVAKTEGVDVLEGITEHLGWLRTQARDAAPTDATAESGTERFDATLDRDARTVSILRTETSDAIEGDDGVTQWPEAVDADHDVVRAAIEATLGVWIEALPSDGWSATEFEGETVASVRLSADQPTHRIVWRPQGGAERVTVVRLVEGVAYTHAEWESETAADWERTDAGEWCFQGQATPGGANGEVTINRI